MQFLSLTKRPLIIRYFWLKIPQSIISIAELFPSLSIRTSTSSGLCFTLPFHHLAFISYHSSAASDSHILKFSYIAISSFPANLNGAPPGYTRCSGSIYIYGLIYHFRIKKFCFVALRYFQKLSNNNPIFHNFNCYIPF